MPHSSRPLVPFAAEAGAATDLLKEIANRSRLLILCYLADYGELSVGELAGHVGLGQSALSQHLARLRERGLVVNRKEAQTVYYRVGDSRVQQVLTLLHDMFCPELGRSGAR